MDTTLLHRPAGRNHAAHDCGDDPATPCDRPQPDRGTAPDEVISVKDGVPTFTRRIADQANHGTAPATRPAEPAADSPIVVICAWCPHLHILKLQRREVDVIVAFQQGKELNITRNGLKLRISHGICQPCRERLKK